MRARRKSRPHRTLATLLVLFASAGIALEACSDESFSGVEPTDASPDGTTSDGAADAAVDVSVITPFDGGACNLAMPFGAMSPIDALNLPNTISQTARLTHDELNIYFQQETIDAGISVMSDAGDGGNVTPPVFFQLMTSSRPSTSADWSKPVPVGGVGNPIANETDPSVTSDNDILYFTSNQIATGAKGGNDIWVATRGTPTTSFSAATDVSSLNTSGEESQPYMMPSGTSFYYRTKLTGNFDLAHATRTTTGDFSPDLDSGIFQNVNTTKAVEQLATVTFDELTVYFATDRADAGMGGREIWKATRTSTSVPFDPPTSVDELNTAGFTEPSWISDDGCRIYITSTKSGTAELYVAAKPAN